MSGNKDNMLNLYHYPIIKGYSDNKKTYTSHSFPIQRGVFSPDDKYLITIGGEDNSIFLWSINPIEIFNS